MFTSTRPTHRDYLGQREGSLPYLRTAQAKVSSNLPYGVSTTEEICFFDTSRKAFMPNPWCYIFPINIGGHCDRYATRLIQPMSIPLSTHPCRPRWLESMAVKLIILIRCTHFYAFALSKVHSII